MSLPFSSHSQSFLNLRRQIHAWPLLLSTRKEPMTDHTEKKCPKCGQYVRIPKKIGEWMLMACPSCGCEFQADLTVGVGRKKGLAQTIFEMPNEILSRLCRYFKSWINPLCKKRQTVAYRLQNKATDQKHFRFVWTQKKPTQKSGLRYVNLW